MEMLERCPGCSVTREAEPSKAESGPRPPRPCAHCGYDGPFPSAEAERVSSPRDSLPSFAGARAKLATATQDLFRLSGNYSIPVEAAVSEPPAPPPPAAEAPASSGRKPEQSIMFSLEALMKANAPAASTGAASSNVEEVSDQLWNMQAQTPLFGTAHDQALLTTPLKLEPAPSMDSMTLPSHAPNGRRWLPIVLAACGGLALAGAGIWVFTAKPAEPAAAASPPPATLAAPPAEPVAEPGEKQPAAGEVAEPAAPAAATPEETTPPEPAPSDAIGAAGAGGAAASEPEPGEASGPSAAAAPAKEAPVREKPSSKRPTARATPSSTKAAFDKGAAKTALNAAAAQAAGCGQGGAPGKGKIQVTFATSGKVSSAQLVEGPFGGTAAGKCALRHFKAAKVPAFSGAAVTVAKSFKVD